LAALCRADEFRKGHFDTGLIDRNLLALGAAPQELDRAAAALGAQMLLARENDRIAASGESEPDEPASPWDASDAFQLAGARRLALPIIADGEGEVAQVIHGPRGPVVTVDGVAPATDAVVVEAGDAVYVLRKGRQTKVTLRDLNLDEAGDHGSGGLVRAPMHGKVLAILVEQGERVTRGQRLAIIEAMKMEHTLIAPIDGTVTEIAVAKDAQIAEAAKVIVIEPAEATD